MTTIQLADASVSTKDIQSTILPPQKRCRLIQHALKAGAKFERHGSDVSATIQTISGQGSISSEGKVASLRPGTLCSLHAGQVSTVSADSALVILVSEYLTANIPC